MRVRKLGNFLISDIWSHFSYPVKYNLILISSQECAAKVAELTGIASQELDLEQVLFTACEPMVDKFCSKVAKQEDEGQVLGCLINHKNDEEMDEKCRAGVFHFQIISLSDYKLSYAFFKGRKKLPRIRNLKF